MMNKEPRDITIENSAFSLTIHFNPDLVLTQLCVVGLCVVAMFIFPEGGIHTLAVLFLIIDIGSLLFGLLCKNTSSNNKDTKEKSTHSDKKEMKEKSSAEKPVETVKSNNTHTSLRIEKDVPIKNKLEVATPKPGAKVTPVPLTSENANTEPEIADTVSPVSAVPQEVTDALASFFSDGFDDDDEF